MLYLQPNRLFMTNRIGAVKIYARPVSCCDGDGRHETQISNMHHPSGLEITSDTCPGCIVGELASHLEVNCDFPIIGPCVSAVDQQSNMLSRLDIVQGAGLGSGQFLSPKNIAYDSTCYQYEREVVDADWTRVMGDSEKPDQPKRFQ